MAVRREVIEHFSDDLDGTAADESIKFSFEGKSFVIDLSKKNAAAFRKAVGPYIEAGRRDSGARTRTSSASSSRASSSGLDLAAVREWAAKEGHEIAARGRVKKEVIEKYLAAH